MITFLLSTPTSTRPIQEAPAPARFHQQGFDSVVLSRVHSQEWHLLLSQHLSSSEGFYVVVALNPHHVQAGREVFNPFYRTGNGGRTREVKSHS